MNRREIEALLEVVRQARATGEPAALATIVRVRGNAYRREGTHMLVRRNGTFECALSGGCLEPAVADAAARVIETGEPVVVNYDLADDSIWGLGIGCTGAVDVRIERIGDDPMLDEWLRTLEHGDAAIFVTPLSGAAGRLIVGRSGEPAGHLSDPALEQQAIRSARAELASPYPRSGPRRIGGAELFQEVALPPPHLVVFGAGHDAAPVVELARTLGFAVTVVDPRESFLTPERFPGAALVCAGADQFDRAVDVPGDAFVVIMNHHLERDRAALRLGLESAARYVGVLGPRSRYERLLSDLAAEGYRPDAAKLQPVRSPIGLAVGAETPEEVAMSILGEIVAIARGFSGGFLTGSVASLHTPEDSLRAARS
jgi:xanthine/CO dehydrogenase XdhC/CoxF family maturation factor